MTLTGSSYLVALLLLVIQLLAAAPWAWLLFLKREDVLRSLRGFNDVVRKGGPVLRSDC